MAWLDAQPGKSRSRKVEALVDEARQSEVVRLPREFVEWLDARRGGSRESKILAILANERQTDEMAAQACKLLAEPVEWPESPDD